MTETFTPPRPPDVSSSKDTKAKVLTASFGDGYSQRAADGLNAISSALSLSWTNLTPDQADDIEDFLKARGGYEAFLWTPPREVSALKWTCNKWKRGYDHGVVDSVTATFEQVFDL